MNSYDQNPFIIKCLLYHPSASKTENLDKDDITILSLIPEDTAILIFKPEIAGDFIKTNDLSPKGSNIFISFNQDDYIHKRKYGIYTKKTKKNNPSINI